MEKIIIFLHDNREVITSVPSYEVEDFTEKLNSNTSIMINIGDVIIHKNSIKLIVPETTSSIINIQKY